MHSRLNAEGKNNGLGIYDRDYFRQERPGFSLGLPHSAVVTLILLNAAVWVADGLLGEGHWLNSLLAAHVGVVTQPGMLLHPPSWWQSGTLAHPWLWWQFVTYGFVHEAGDVSHILFNMLTLWFLGRDVEERYSRAEFVRLYLLLLVIGGVAWAAVNSLLVPAAERFRDFRVIGASGAVTGIVILYALNFPRRTLLFMFVLPMPAWVLGVMVVLFDIFGAIGRPGSQRGLLRSPGRGRLRRALLPAAMELRRAAAGALRLALVPLPRWVADPSPPAGRRPFRARDPRKGGRSHPGEDPSRGGRQLDAKERRILETASREYQQRLRGE